MRAFFNPGRKQAVAFLLCVAAMLLVAVIVTWDPVGVFDQHVENHILIHMALDVFSVILPIMVVSGAWAGLRYRHQAITKPLVFGFTVVAGTGVLHMLTYNGMPSLLMGSASEKAVFYWLISRGFEVLTMVLVVSRLQLPGSVMFWFCLGLAVAGCAGLAGAYGFVVNVAEIGFVFSTANSELLGLFSLVNRLAAYALIYVVVFLMTDQKPYQNKKHLQAVIKENGELKLALNAHAIVASTDARGVITRVNDKFCTISQYSREELIGKTHRVINSGHHPREFFQNLWRTISRGDVWAGDVCNRAKDGSLYWVQSTVVPLIGKNGKPEQYVAIRADITARKEAEAKAQRMALHDSLTGLPNRRLLEDRLSHAVTSKGRHPEYSAVLMMDLDHFKEVNDTLGHAVGDELLQQTTLRLTASVRQMDTVARFGGDEFVTILDNVGADLKSAVANTESIGEAIRKKLSEPYQLGSQQLEITSSMGVVLFNTPDSDPEELIKQADIALYGAKEAGRNQLCFFDPVLQAETVERALLMRDLRHALEKHELALFYQPIVDDKRHIKSVEALIRWFHPEHGPVPPDKFIPLAEKSGLIFPIGEWVLKTACSQLALWSEDPQRQA